MADLFSELDQFLRQYRDIYGSNLYMDGELTDPKITSRNEKRQLPFAGRGDIPGPGRTAEPDFSANPPLQELFLAIRDCQKCHLGAKRKNFVFGVGNPNADVVLVGEAPGREEDEQGIPFVGAAGRLLDKMLWSIGLSRDEVFIANVLKCRPPNNRDPQPEEVMHCEPYLKQQLEIIKPRLLVALGRIAAQVLLKREDPLRVLRESQQHYEEISLIVTYHPAALLRNPSWKANAWADLKKIKKAIKK